MLQFLSCILYCRGYYLLSYCLLDLIWLAKHMWSSQQLSFLSLLWNESTLMAVAFVSPSSWWRIFNNKAYHAIIAARHSCLYCSSFVLHHKFCKWPGPEYSHNSKILFLLWSLVGSKRFSNWMTSTAKLQLHFHNECTSSGNDKDNDGSASSFPRLASWRSHRCFQSIIRSRSQEGKASNANSRQRCNSKTDARPIGYMIGTINAIV